MKIKDINKKKKKKKKKIRVQKVAIRLTKQALRDNRAGRYNQSRST